MQRKTSALFGLLFIALWSCGREALPSKPAALSGISIEESVALASQASVICQDSRQCDPSVAMVTAAMVGDVKACTATLVAENIIITNSHCLPNEVRSSQVSCEGRIWAIFPKREGYSEQKAGCSSVLYASDFGTAANPKTDFAYLLLSDKIKRPYREVDRSGVEDGEVLSTGKIDPIISKALVAGYLKQTTCKARHGAEFIPNSNSEFSDLVSLHGCKFVYGNSGSALLAPSGKIKAVAQLTLNSSRKEAELERKQIPFIEAKQLPAGAGTNLACQPSPFSTLDLPPACSDPGRNREFSPMEIQQKQHKRILQLLQVRMSQEGYPANQFLWDFEWNEPALYTPSLPLAIQPRCWLGKSNAPHTSLSFIAPVLSAKLGLDSYYIPSAIIEDTKGYYTYHIQFASSESADENEGNLSSPERTAEIHLCSKEQEINLGRIHHSE